MGTARKKTHVPTGNSDRIEDYLKGYTTRGKKPLTREEEIELAKRIEQGDTQAKEIFVRRNIGLVLSIAKKFKSRSMSIQDMAQEGVIGLLKAIDKFDHRLGYKFSVYATWWVRQQITRAIENKSKIIRIPVNLNQEVMRVVKERDQLQGSDILNVSDTLAEKMGMEKDKIEDLLRIADIQPSYMDAEMYGDEDPNGRTYYNYIADDENVEDEVGHIFLREDLMGLLTDTLTEKEQEVIKHRFGFYGVDKPSLRYVGKQLGVSGEYVRRLEKRALEKLKSVGDTERLREYV